MNNFIKILIISLFVFLNRPVSAVENISEREIVMLDSMLMEGGYPQVISFFNETDMKYQTGISNDVQLECYEANKTNYLKLVRHFQIIDKMYDQKIDQQIDHFLPIAVTFQKKRNTQRVINYLQKFMTNLDVGKSRLALKYYFLAYYHRILSREKIRTDLENQYQLVRNLISVSKFDSAQIIFHGMKRLAADFYLKEELNFNFNGTENEIRKGLNEAQLKYQMFGQKELVRKTCFFKAGAQLMVFNSKITEDQIWIFTAMHSPEYTAYYNYYIDEVCAGTGMAVAFDAGGYLLNRCRLSVHYNYGLNKYKIIKLKSTFENDFQVHYSTVQIRSDYLFVQKAGLRPFIGVGIGELFGVRDRKESDSPLLNEDRQFFAEEKFQITQMILGFGAEYIPNSESAVLLEFYSTFIYNLDRSKIIGDFMINAGLKAGLIF